MKVTVEHVPMWGFEPGSYVQIGRGCYRIVSVDRDKKEINLRPLYRIERGKRRLTRIWNWLLRR